MTKSRGLSKLQKLKSLHHLLISLGLAVLFFLLSNLLPVDFLTKLMLAWVIFCVGHIGLSWSMFAITTVRQMPQQANLEDESRAAIFVLVLFSTFAGLAAVFLLLSKTESSNPYYWLSVVLAILGMFLSWFLVHTIFTVRYAHLYYGLGEDGGAEYPKGLDFPSEEEPDFIDFAYYSLVIGMTFQVSDVDITSRSIRRVTLLHSVISFVFNTCIVALTINAIAGSFH